MEQKNKDDTVLDEKENGERARGSTTVSAADAAMTQRILLKLDFRYGLSAIAPDMRMETDACFPESCLFLRSCSSAHSSIARMSEMRRHMVWRLVLK
jgi:hypothetical protein